MLFSIFLMPQAPNFRVTFDSPFPSHCIQSCTFSRESEAGRFSLPPPSPFWPKPVSPSDSVRAPAAAAVLFCTIDQMAALVPALCSQWCWPCRIGSLSASSLPSSPLTVTLPPWAPLECSSPRWLSAHNLWDAAFCGFMMQQSSALPKLFPCTCFVFLSSSGYLLVFSYLCVVCLLPRFC